MLKFQAVKTYYAMVTGKTLSCIIMWQQGGSRKNIYRKPIMIMQYRQCYNRMSFSSELPSTNKQTGKQTYKETDSVQILLPYCVQRADDLQCKYEPCDTLLFSTIKQ